jgi:iron complex outermembrane receptor protein
VEEIVVTAQRRSQLLQDVPITITVITAESAANSNVTNIETLTSMVPGLDFSRSTGNGGIPFLRGVGSNVAVSGTESPVAIFVDDVYIGTPSANTFSFNNLASIEVMKGPQGTLFGRNATGGVIMVRTMRPTQEPELKARVGYGNYDTIEGSVFANVPISNTLSMNSAVQYKDQREGYGTNLTTGDDIHKDKDWEVRSRLLWDLTSDTSALLSADYSEVRGDAGLNTEVLPGTISVSAALGGATHGGRYNSFAGTPDKNASDRYGISLDFNHDYGWSNFRSISAFRRTDSKFSLDQDNSPPPLIDIPLVGGYTKNFSQELQVLSPPNEKFTWIVGAYYLRSHAYYALNLQGILPAERNTRSEQILNSYSSFAEGVYEFLPGAHLTVGARYTRDEYDLDTFTRIGEGAGEGGGTINPLSQFSKADTQSEPTYRAILDYRFSPDVMVYASYSRGFKSGNFNLSGPGLAPGAPPLEPEVLDAYEVGIKSELFDRRLRLNAAAYHYSYDNLQVSIVQAGVSLQTNAAAARVNGIDLDFSALPTERLTISGAFTFLDSEYTSFRNGPFFIPNPAVCTPEPMETGPRTGGNLQCEVDLTGYDTVQAPPFTGSIAATYTIPAEVGNFALTASLYHNSGFFWLPENRVEQPEYNLLNANITWRSPSDRHDVTVWASNLLDEYYYSFGTSNSTRDHGVGAMPRSYGIRFGYSF